MATLTVRIPDNKKERFYKVVQNVGGNIISTSNELNRFEQNSLNKAIEEAHLIKSGKMKGLSFDDLWD